MGTDFEKASRSATTKPLPHQTFSRWTFPIGKADQRRIRKASVTFLPQRTHIYDPVCWQWHQQAVS